MRSQPIPDTHFAVRHAINEANASPSAARARTEALDERLYGEARGWDLRRRHMQRQANHVTGVLWIGPAAHAHAQYTHTHMHASTHTETTQNTIKDPRQRTSENHSNSTAGGRNNNRTGCKWTRASAHQRITATAQQGVAPATGCKWTRVSAHQRITATAQQGVATQQQPGVIAHARNALTHARTHARTTAPRAPGRHRRPPTP